MQYWTDMTKYGVFSSKRENCQKRVFADPEKHVFWPFFALLPVWSDRPICIRGIRWFWGLKCSSRSEQNGQKKGSEKWPFLAILGHFGLLEATWPGWPGSIRVPPMKWPYGGQIGLVPNRSESPKRPFWPFWTFWPEALATNIDPQMVISSGLDEPGMCTFTLSTWRSKVLKNTFFSCLK